MIVFVIHHIISMQIVYDFTSYYKLTQFYLDSHHFIHYFTWLYFSCCIIVNIRSLYYTIRLHIVFSYHIVNLPLVLFGLIPSHWVKKIVNLFLELPFFLVQPKQFHIGSKFAQMFTPLPSLTRYLFTGVTWGVMCISVVNGVKGDVWVQSLNS